HVHGEYREIAADLRQVEGLIRERHRDAEKSDLIRQRDLACPDRRLAAGTEAPQRRNRLTQRHVHSAKVRIASAPSSGAACSSATVTALHAWARARSVPSAVRVQSLRLPRLAVPGSRKAARSVMRLASRCRA